MQTGIIILAAGSSSRLGRPKQLLKYRGQSLIGHITDEAIASGCGPVVIVLGAYIDKIKAAIADKPVPILENENWETGMGSTIATGMNFLMSNYPGLKAVILLLSDQPHVDRTIILQLIEKFAATEKEIIASKYGSTAGVPALFSSRFFSKLAAQDGKGGAKKLILSHSGEAGTIQFPEGKVDLDTEEDVRNFFK